MNLARKTTAVIVIALGAILASPFLLIALIPDVWDWAMREVDAR